MNGNDAGPIIPCTPESHIKIGDVPVCSISDDGIIDFFNRGKAAAGRKPLRDDTARVWVGILRSFDECDTPMTVRQMFYQLETRGIVPKTEQGYRQTANHLGNMRKEEAIPYSFIADLTRWIRKPKTHTGLQAALDETRRTYRRSLWNDQRDEVEIWIEKEALIGVIDPITEEYDVGIFPCKGYPSMSFIHAAAESIKSREKWTYIYYFGDHDPAGADIPRHISDELTKMGARRFTLDVVAVNREQIERLGLPERPTKRNKHDHRAKAWVGGSTELDAIPPPVLRELVSMCIECHIDPDILRRTQQIEALERETLDNMAIQFGTSTKFGGVSLEEV
ncbi:MAG: hypothetical protein JXA08_05080 [Methanomicrobiaceae archaeon]|nr:hypothetical protein [Methanomicrobiaceae archaeon]